MPPPPAAVAIIGAGMSGLIAARELHCRGIDTVVLEAADRVGGRMMAETSALGSRIDLGGQWIGHGHHRFEALADELGATRFDMHTPKRPSIVDGEQVISPIAPSMIVANAALVGADVLSRLAIPARWNTASVRSWLARLPSARARRLLDVATVVTSTADPERLSVEALLRLIRFQGGLAGMMKTRGGAQQSLVVEGAATLVDRLAVELGERVRTGCRVTAVRQDRGGVSLDTTAGTVRAGKAVVAVPPPIAARIVFEPALPAERIAVQHNTYMGSVYKAIAVYDAPFWRDHGDAESILLGEPGCAVFDTSPPGGPGHLCMLVAGPGARGLDDLDADGRRAALLDRLVPFLGSKVLRPASWHEKSWHRDPFVGGGYLALPEPGTRDGFFPMPCSPIGDIHWAGTETASTHAGYIEGAIEAGSRATLEILNLLQPTT